MKPREEFEQEGQDKGRQDKRRQDKEGQPFLSNFQIRQERLSLFVLLLNCLKKVFQKSPSKKVHPAFFALVLHNKNLQNYHTKAEYLIHDYIKKSCRK